MMKLCSRLCLFGFILVSSLARGQNETEDRLTTTPLPPDDPPRQPEQRNSTTSHTMRAAEEVVTPGPLTPGPGVKTSPSPAQSLTTANLMDRSSNVSTEETPSTDDYATTEENEDNSLDNRMVDGDTTPQTFTPSVTKRDAVSNAMTTMTTKPALAKERDASWGYVILVMIILAVIALCIILFLLRRQSRRYSFDLHRPGQFNHNGPEHTGTFEPVYLDDLDRPAPTDHVTSDDLSPPPVANGTSLQSGEKGPAGENAPNGQADGDGLDSPTITNIDLSLDIDLTDKKSNHSGSSDLFFDAAGEEQQNGNNNNPSLGSSEPFVEINLDEPVSCDHLLTSPEPASSVLPFSPFSLSSSP